MRDIVANRIPKNMVKSFVVGYIERLLLHNDDQLCFPIHRRCEVALSLVALGDGDRITRRVERRERFVEQDRPPGDCHVALNKYVFIFHKKAVCHISKCCSLHRCERCSLGQHSEQYGRVHSARVPTAF